MMLKTVLALVLVLVLGLLTYAYLERADTPAQANARAVDELVTRNIAARGGAEAWRSVSSLRLTGRMDLGHEMVVPYVLEQKRPDKMCLEFVFDGETAVHCTDGNSGWKVVPFRGRTTPEPMTGAELRETADSADLYGLLFDYAARGHVVELLGHEPVEGRDTFKLKVTLPRGGVRWLYLDAETALEVKLEALRTLGRRERRVETYYHDWQPAEGLLIPRRQETSTEGDTESHFLTVESVSVNPPLEDARFMIPPATTVGDDRGPAQETSS
jgi:hypothetical protein